MLKRKNITEKTLKNLQKDMKEWIKSIPFLRNFWYGKEFFIFLFFCFLFLILIFKLFQTSVVNNNNLESQLNDQHSSKSLLKAKRGSIYVMDKWENPIKLTENITLYNIFLDPSLIWDKNKAINILAPLLYEHFCDYYGLTKVNKEQCIKNIEIFSDSKILPKKPEIFYYGSWVIKENFWNFSDMTGYENKRTEVMSWFTEEKAIYLIKKWLDEKIHVGVKKLNYLGFASNEGLISALEMANQPYITIEDQHYIYINPHILSNNEGKQAKAYLKNILIKYGYPDFVQRLENAFKEQKSRYVKIASNVNSQIAQKARKLKEEYASERYFIPWERVKVGILHGLWLETNTVRYYPLWSFMANTLGYVDKKGNAFHGVEEYFNDTLKGIDGKIEGRATSVLWGVGANEFKVKNVKDGEDIYLTIDVGIQKKIEEIAQNSKERFKADSVNIIVYNPFNWQVKADVNYPSFNPNNYNNAYTLKPVTPEQKEIIDDITYMDIPVYVKTWWITKLAKLSERTDPSLEKYLPENTYGAIVFTDKTTNLAYEPGSIFKVLTTAIGLDTDEIDFYDTYTETGYVKIWPYKISNADKKNCKGKIAFLDALTYSCNIGMIRIAQRINRDMFYNYLKQMGIWQKTGIEVANENGGSVSSPSSISKVGYFNNTFWQGILVTPLQMVSALWTIINGGYYIKPTLVKKTYNPNTWITTENKKKIVKQVFKPETSEEIRKGLYVAMEKNKGYIKYIRNPWKHTWGKSWTSQIAYQGKYQAGAGRTNGSYMGVDNTENPQYIILVQIRRPRTSEWWSQTAGRIFKEVSAFILSYTNEK